MGLPIVLVHGILDTPVIFSSLKKTLEQEGFQVYAPSLSPNTGKFGIPHLAKQLQKFIDSQLKSDQDFNLLGYSMGGLICRYYMQRLGGFDRVERLVTVSSPHHGSYMAWFILNKAGFQMRPNSDFIQGLNRDIASLTAIRFTSIWTPWDLSIVPASSSVTQVGKNVKVHVLAHVWMMFSKDVKREVLKILSVS